MCHLIEIQHNVLHCVTLCIPLGNKGTGVNKFQCSAMICKCFIICNDVTSKILWCCNFSPLKNLLDYFFNLTFWILRNVCTLWSSQHVQLLFLCDQKGQWTYSRVISQVQRFVEISVLIQCLILCWACPCFPPLSPVDTLVASLMSSLQSFAMSWSVGLSWIFMTGLF